MFIRNDGDDKLIICSASKMIANQFQIVTSAVVHSFVQGPWDMLSSLTQHGGDDEQNKLSDEQKNFKSCDNQKKCREKNDKKIKNKMTERNTIHK